MCQVLGVARSGYYDWCRRLDQDPSARAAEDEKLLAEIRQINLRFRYYGYPRIHQELLARGHHVGRHRVARLMRRHGIRACRGRILLRPRSAPPARRPEVVDRVRRDFTVVVPNRLWFTDITQIRTSQGWVYAAVIVDAFNREVIGWATEDLDSPRTANRAFVEAVASRRPPKGCIIHSDRGYQFTAKAWIDYATDHHLVVSMGEHGNPLDNAVMESWFASFKTEELYPGGQPATRTEARARLFHYIWDYNHHRRHSTLGFVAPIIYATESSTCP
jgi:putative transposase